MDVTVFEKMMSVFLYSTACPHNKFNQFDLKKTGEVTLKSKRSEKTFFLIPRYFLNPKWSLYIFFKIASILTLVIL